ncbi:YibE/F family protein [Bacillus tianshenii]|uniref:YibE/F family protein n=1 Tax=Sutcliffiella tianshenii TaxID=1463404 RepID=UPI0019591C66
MTQEWKELYIVNKLKKVVTNNLFLYSILGLCFILSLIFVNHNHSFYNEPIAEVIETDVKDKEEVVDSFNNKDLLTTQAIIAKVINGEHKEEMIHLTNKFSLSGAYDQEQEVGNELFVSIDSGKSPLTGTITGVKRDTYVLIVAWIFIFVLLLVGRKQGFYSIVSLAVNALLISFLLDIFLHSSNISLLLICGIGVILFTLMSLLLVNGFNEKTFAAIVSTLLGTFFSLLITFLVMWLTKEKGLRYEEMQFLTSPPQVVFMAGLLIGSLGAVMDVAITMSSSIFGLYEEKHDISEKALRDSGMEIGKDIMGTMTNILFFAYISGSIPMLILYLMNDFPFGITLSINLSLELARALAGGIGIVLTIPIGLYISIFFVNRKRARL